MLLHAVDQGTAADIELPGSLRLIALEFFECAADELAFNDFQTEPSSGSAATAQRYVQTER